MNSKFVLLESAFQIFEIICASQTFCATIYFCNWSNFEDFLKKIPVESINFAVSARQIESESDVMNVYFHIICHVDLGRQ